MKTLVAYAYLVANCDAGNRDPIGILDYVVSRAAFDLTGKFKPISLKKHIQAIWGIDIPANVIQYSLQRLKSQGEVERVSENGHNDLFQLTLSNARKSSIKSNEKRAYDRYTRLISKINGVLHAESYLQGATADLVLEEWLDHGATAFLGGQVPTKNATSREVEVNSIIAKVLKVVEDPDKEALEDISEIALGDSLYRSLQHITEHDFADDKDSRRKPMSAVKVYIDVGILGKAIGYFGIENKVATLEFLDMARETGCELLAFRHTVAELGEVVAAAAHKLQYRQDQAYGPIVAYALEEGILPSTLINEAFEIEQKVQELEIAVVDHPQIEAALYPSEKAFTELLESELRQDNPVARNRDVDSLFSIYQLRQGKGFDHLEKCQAIFITRNNGLQAVSQKFFRRLFGEEGIQNSVQLCMTDMVFCSRLWTKLPTAVNWLPRKQVVAAALANLTVSDAVRDSFIEKIREFVRRGILSETDAYTVTCSKFAHRILALDYRHGDSVSEKNAQSIAVMSLKKIKSNLETARLEGKNEGVAEARSELDDTIRRLSSANIQQSEENTRSIEELKKLLATRDGEVSTARNIAATLANWVMRALFALVWTGFAATMVFSADVGTLFSNWNLLATLSGALLLWMSWYGYSSVDLRNSIAKRATEAILKKFAK
jgi:hypothetical protein